MILSVDRRSTRGAKPARPLLKDDRGAAAIEFALIAPILVMFYFAVVELSLALDANRKVSLTASVIGDLVAQADEVSVNEVEAILDAADATMQPLNVGALELRITSLIMDNGGDTEVTWSRSRNTDPHACGASMATPDGVLAPNQSIILAEVSYTYEPPLGHFLTGDMVLTDTFYLRPRRSVEVKLDPPQC